ERRVAIEFEYRSRDFRTHKHDPRGCNVIVCWEHNWLLAPPKLEVIELRRYFGLGFNVWIQPVDERLKDIPTRFTTGEWSVDSGGSKGDLVLFYRTAPDALIADAGVILTPVVHARA